MKALRQLALAPALAMLTAPKQRPLGLRTLRAHGYDPADPEMAALFIAYGPAFRRGLVLQPFDNVSVYPLLARLIGVTPEANDGDSAATAPALR